MSDKKLEAVFFDCWDTLISFEMKTKAWNFEPLRKHTLHPESVNWDEVNEFVETFLKGYYFSHSLYEIKDDSVMRLVVRYFHLELDCDIDTCVSEVLTHLDPKPIPHIEDFLKLLDDNHIPYGVLSNTIYTEKDTKDLIDKLIPSNHCQFVFGSADVAVKKPNPIFFQLGCRYLNVKEENSIYIGDSFNLDVMGSQKAGYGTSIWLNHKNKVLEEMTWIASLGDSDYLKTPHVEAKSYLDVIDFVKRTYLCND